MFLVACAVNGPGVQAGDSSGEFDFSDTCSCNLHTVASQSADIVCAHGDFTIPILAFDAPFLAHFVYATSEVDDIGPWSNETGDGLFYLDSTQVPDPRGDPYLLIYKRFYLDRMELAGGQHCNGGGECVTYAHSTAENARFYCTYEGGTQ